MTESLFIESLVNQCSIVLQSGVKHPFFFFLIDSINQLEILSNSFILRGVVLTFEIKEDSGSISIPIVL